MAFLASFRRALTAAFLFVSFAASQTCYYPDGQTISTDVPCNSTAAASSCCPSDSFCLDNGLCYGAGLISRASCTDATWGSEACAGYCKTESPNTGISITPCSSDAGTNTFVCGLNSTDCQTDTKTFVMTGGSGLVLRPSQIAALVEPALEATSAATTTASQATVTSCPSQSAAANTAGVYSSSDMAGLGCGLGLPLFFALCAALILLRREKQKHAPPKLMYKLPDDDIKSEFTFRPPPTFGERSGYSPSSPSSLVNSATTSRRESFRTAASQKPVHMQSFFERYETMKKSSAQEIGSGNQRHELDVTSPFEDVPPHQRHELGESRMSK